MATAFLATSCASQKTPEQKHREERIQERKEVVSALTPIAADYLHLSAVEQAILGHKAQQIAWDKDPVARAQEELDKHPEFKEKVQKGIEWWVKENP